MSSRCQIRFQQRYHDRGEDKTHSIARCERSKTLERSQKEEAAAMQESKKKDAPLHHEDWLARCPKATQASIAKALEILDRPTLQAPEEADKFPKGYVSVRRKAASGR
jgi:hypothetical protein